MTEFGNPTETLVKCMRQVGADGYTGVLYLYHHSTAQLIVQWTGSYISPRNKECAENNLLNILTNESMGALKQTVKSSAFPNSLAPASDQFTDVGRRVPGDIRSSDVQAITNPLNRMSQNQGLGLSNTVPPDLSPNSLMDHLDLDIGDGVETSAMRFPKSEATSAVLAETGQDLVSTEIALLTASEALYRCTDCNKTFTSSTNLSKHRRIHTGRRPYKCNVCDKAFVRSNHLVSHQRRHTGEKPFTCDVCQTPFSNKGDLVRHMRCHTGEKPYQCLVCNKKFTRSNNLVRHQKNHLEQKPHKCTICDKTFVQSDHLARHQRSHTGDRPHKCAICDKAFTAKGDLVRHNRTHTGEKPYKCTLCNRAFSRSTYLVDHQKTHTEPAVPPTIIRGGELDGVITLHVSSPSDPCPVNEQVPSSQALV